MSENTRDLASEASADMVGPAGVFAAHGIDRVVVILGSGLDGGLTERYRDEAFELAARLTAWSREKSANQRLWVCSGGKGGIMAAVSAGVASAGGTPLGFGFDIEGRGPNRFQSPDATHLFLFPGLRNHWMFRKMVALVAFPGGVGTLAEVYDALLHAQLSISPRVPIFLYGSEFWRRHVALEDLIDLGLTPASDLQSVVYTDDTDSLLAKMLTG